MIVSITLLKKKILQKITNAIVRCGIPTLAKKLLSLSHGSNRTLKVVTTISDVPSMAETNPHGLGVVVATLAFLTWQRVVK